MCVCARMHTQLCLTLCNPTDCNPSLSMEFSRQGYWSGLPFPPPTGSSQPRDWTYVSWVSCTGRRILYRKPDVQKLNFDELIWYLFLLFLPVLSVSYPTNQCQIWCLGHLPWNVGCCTQGCLLRPWGMVNAMQEVKSPVPLSGSAASDQSVWLNSTVPKYLPLDNSCWSNSC